MRTKPLIGITMNLEKQKTRSLNILDQDYAKAVLDAGGIPVPVISVDACIRDLVSRLDGVLFTGGDDIHPRYYNERPLRAAKMTLSEDDRTDFEIKLFKAAYRARKPVLAICGGEQLINVALGGTLYQDMQLQLGTTMKHRPSRTGEKIFHEVIIKKDARLFRIMGSGSIEIRSAHHQSVKKLGKGLHVSAVSSDGVIEAFEADSKGFLIAVQWHPEKKRHDRYTKKLFKAFINAAR